MGRPGRHRKKGRRKACGRLAERKPKPKVEENVRIARRQPHRRGLKSALRIDEKAESPLGRLALAGVINNDQYDAGTWFSVIVGSYRSVIEAPKSVGGSGKGFDCCMGAGDKPEDNCECLRRRARYERAFEVLMGVGREAAVAVSRAAVHRESADPEALAAGLTALARHFGFD